MDTLFLNVFNMSITASWLVLAVTILRLFLKKAPKWINCLLWLIVGIRLLCPFSIESAVSIVPSTETIPTTITTSETPSISSGIKIVDEAINPVITENFTPKVTASVNPMEIIINVASIVWIAGIIVMALYMIISYTSLKFKLRTATLLYDNVYQSEIIKSPFVMGIIKPKIYLPYNVDMDNIDQIILHEKAHLKRHDNIIKPIAFLILSVYWFNPVIWLAFVFLCKDIELACDEKTVRNMKKEEKQSYAKVLLENSTKDFSVIACPFSFGGGSIKNRIKKVINYKRPAHWVVICASILCVSVAICFFISPINNVSKNKNKTQKVDISENLDNDFYSLSITEIPYEKHWLSTRLDDVGLSEDEIVGRDKTVFIHNNGESGFESEVVLFKKPMKNSAASNYYLAIQTFSKVKFIQLNSSYPPYTSYGVEMSLRDIDGESGIDGVSGDEIIINQCVSLTGGAGGYISRIFKVNVDEVVEFFHSSSPDNCFDTGFENDFADGFKLIIKNKFTNFKSTYDMRKGKKYTGLYFLPKSGEVIKNKNVLMVDTFNAFAPIDIDSDGVYEISCKQYCSLYGHMDYIGDAESIIKYNSDTSKFEVIQATFNFNEDK